MLFFNCSIMDALMTGTIITETVVSHAYIWDRSINQSWEAFKTTVRQKDRSGLADWIEIMFWIHN
jgi:hypothetical protein